MSNISQLMLSKDERGKFEIATGASHDVKIKVDSSKTKNIPTSTEIIYTEIKYLYTTKEDSDEYPDDERDWLEGIIKIALIRDSETKIKELNDNLVHCQKSCNNNQLNEKLKEKDLELRQCQKSLENKNANNTTIIYRTKKCNKTINSPPPQTETDNFADILDKRIDQLTVHKNRLDKTSNNPEEWLNQYEYFIRRNKRYRNQATEAAINMKPPLTQDNFLYEDK